MKVNFLKMPRTLIAEIGINHLGNMNLARQMILSAAEAGATHAKFQTYKSSRLKPGPWDTDGRRVLYENSELSEDDHHYLIKECKSAGVRFLTSVFSQHDVTFISSLITEIKIPSAELRNESLIKAINVSNIQKVYLSTGSSTWNEVHKTINLLLSFNKEVIPMHCVSAYPTPINCCNMTRINRLKQENQDCNIGYSGHYNGIEDALLAIGMGVDVVEKHFTIDKSLPGHDNAFSILPDQLRQIAQFWEIAHDMKSNPNVRFQDIELENRNLYSGRWDA